MSHPKQSHSVNCHIRNEVPWKIQVKLKSCNKLASFFYFLPQKCTLLYGSHFSFSPQENTEKFKNLCRMGYFHIFGQTSQKFKKYQTTRRAYVCIYSGMRQRKIKKRGKLLHVRERSDRTSWGWVREGGSPSRRKFCNFRYWKSCFNAEKNQKKRKIATCEGAQRPNLLGVGSGGGFPLPQKILQF